MWAEVGFWTEARRDGGRPHSNVCRAPWRQTRHLGQIGGPHCASCAELLRSEDGASL